MSLCVPPNGSKNDQWLTLKKDKVDMMHHRLQNILAKSK
jgi:hypothetical protein